MVMDIIAEPRAWAELQFGQVALGDARRTRRLVASATQIARHPAHSFPQIFDWNGLRGFYGVCHRQRAPLPALQHPPLELTPPANGQRPPVAFLPHARQLAHTS